MIESKGWNWKMVQNDKANIWMEPSIESYYLLSIYLQAASAATAPSADAVVI